MIKFEGSKVFQGKAEQVNTKQVRWQIAPPFSVITVPKISGIGNYC